MRKHPLSAIDLLRALERFGPQARPYNFDDCFDCWGLVRRVFDALDDGYEVNEELGEAGDGAEVNWAPIESRGDLVPGDLLTTHARLDGEFHTVFYCGRAGGVDLVYDSSPRGLIPLFERRGCDWTLVAHRAVYTRFMRATEATDRLRHDGGAYLRLWDDRERFYNRAVHERLLAGRTTEGAAGGGAVGRDLVALRRAAGLSDLPFYCRRRLPRDSAGREIYDNRLTRHLDYYVPDAAPVPDDLYEALMERGEAAPGAPRPPAPRLVRAPHWVVRDEPVTVEWAYPGADPDGVGDVDGCRIELWEETWDVWKERLLRRDFDDPRTAFTVPSGLLHADSRFAVAVYARGPGGFSGTALAPFLYRPAADSPLLGYDPVRPEGLWPDQGVTLAAGEAVELRWRIREPRLSQVAASVTVIEDGCLTDGLVPVFEVRLEGPAATACTCAIPAARLRGGHAYAWYVIAHAADGRTAFAPCEGVFTISEGG